MSQVVFILACTPPPFWRDNFKLYSNITTTLRKARGYVAPIRSFDARKEKTPTHINTSYNNHKDRNWYIYLSLSFSSYWKHLQILKSPAKFDKTIYTKGVKFFIWFDKELQNISQKSDIFVLFMFLKIKLYWWTH